MNFEEIYSQYSPKIFRVCMGYTNDRELANDLTQETFISVWQHLESFRNESKISTWIYRIATNNCLRAMEKSKRISKVPFPADIEQKHEETQGLSALGTEEKLQFLYNCIAELEETDRIIISLVLEDVAQADIAAVTGLSEVNTRVKIHRIKEKLTKKFKAHGQFE